MLRCVTALAVLLVPVLAGADAPDDHAPSSESLAGDMPRGHYEWVPPEYMPEPSDEPREAGQSLLIYMNRHGGTYTPGYNDSATNSSTIVRGTSTVPAWQISDDGWAFVMECVKDQFSRFNIVITDEDPGDVDHIESVVAGRPSDIGMGGGVGGVSPFTCGTLERSIVFTFAEIYGPNYQEVCHTVAQEVAHSFGLDHEYLCQDPMTYLNGCGPKSFQDIDAQCGEFEPRSCNCGGSTQNSVQKMLEKFGPADPVAPTAELMSPADGDVVDPGFQIIAHAEDDRQLERVDFYIDDGWQGVRTEGPFEVNTQPVPSGVHLVEVVATDGPNDARKAVTVYVKGDDLPESCGDDIECPSGFDCRSGECKVTKQDFEPRQTGAYCASDEHCESGMCAEDDRDRRCTASCDPAAEDSCPTGFDCVAAGDGNLCWPKPRQTGGGCQAAGSGGSPLLLLLALGLLIARRRRTP